MSPCACLATAAAKIKVYDLRSKRQADLERAGACYILARGYDDVTEGISNFLRRVK